MEQVVQDKIVRKLQGEIQEIQSALFRMQIEEKNLREHLAAKMGALELLSQLPQIESQFRENFNEPSQGNVDESDSK